MFKEVADKWAEALRSGKYRQGYAQLRSVGYETNEERTETTAVDKFCCLGVLCDLHRLETSGDSRWCDMAYCPNDYETERNYLPSSVAVWAGTQDEDPTVLADKAASLSEWNDKGATFEQIADYIEANWEIL